MKIETEDTAAEAKELIKKYLIKEDRRIKYFYEENYSEALILEQEFKDCVFDFKTRFARGITDEEEELIHYFWIRAIQSFQYEYNKCVGDINMIEQSGKYYV